MSRGDQFTNEFNAAPNGETITTARFALLDGTFRYYATEEATIDGQLYKDDLIECEDIEESEDSGIDSADLVIQNVDKIIGTEIQARLIHFAQVSIGKYFIKPNGETGWRETFFGVAFPLSSNEREAKIEVRDNMVAAGTCIAKDTLGANCQNIYKGLRCGYTGSEPTCPKTLKGCYIPHRFFGETFPLVKNETAPTAPSDTELGNQSGGSYGGDYGIGRRWKQDPLMDERIY